MPLREATRTLRRLIDKQLFFDFAVSTKLDWSLLCCGMDAIEDAGMACEWFLESRNKRVNDRSKGSAYAELYGALQATTIIQDVVSDLNEQAHGHPIKPTQLPERMRKMRQTRVWIAGHPTRGDGKRGRTRKTFTSADSVDDHTLTILQVDGDERTVSHVPVVQLVEDTLGWAATEINAVSHSLATTFKTWKESRMTPTLQSLFEMSTYHLTKVYEATKPHGEPDAWLAKADGKMLVSIARQFVSTLNERSLDATDATTDLDLLEDAIERICDELAKSTATGDEHHRLSTMLYDAVATKTEALRGLAIAIDEKLSE